MDPNKLPPAFCVLPWMHTAINPNGDVSPCCMSKFGFSYGNLNKTPLLKDIFNSDIAKSLRKEMLESDRLPEVCNRCSYLETMHEEDAVEHRTSSYRQRTNERYKDFIKTLEPRPDGTAEFRQLYIDYRFSNKCNFKCITCGPQLSSSHAVEFKKLAELSPAIYTGMTKALIEVDHASMFKQFKEFGHEVREIYFAGGEPLINDHHYEILQYIIDSQQPIYIYYNTNFSELRYRNHDLLDMWSRVNGPVDIFASIDGYGPEGEAIRFGLDSAAFAENVRTLINSEISNVNLHFSITFGITNCHSVVDTTAWLLDLFPDWYKNKHGIASLAAKIGFNAITFSKEFSTLFMNQQQRQHAIELITKQIEEFKKKFGSAAATNLSKNYLSWISNLDRAAYENKGKRAMILTRWSYMNNTDKIREIDWKQRLPNLARIWAEIWHELDQQSVDMDLKNNHRNQPTIEDINDFVAKHKIGQL